MCDLTNRDTIVLTDKEEHLIRKLRYEVPFGRVTIIMVDGQPDRVEEGIKSTKL